MIFQFNKSEIDKLFVWVFTDPKNQAMLEIVQKNISINGDLTFKKHIKIGNVMMRMQIYPLKNGDVELNITHASIAGLGVFGVVRKKAGELIISSFNQYAPQCNIWKNEKGNIQIHIPGVYFEQFGIVGESILLELSI